MRDRRSGRYGITNLLLNLEPAIALFLFDRSRLAMGALPPGFRIACPRDLPNQTQRDPFRRERQGTMKQEALLGARPIRPLPVVAA